MSDLKTAATLALDALQFMDSHYISLPQQGMQAIKALEEALAKQEQGEPVAWMSEENECIFFDADKPNPMNYDFWTPLYTTPQPAQKPWVGLTDDEFEDIEMSFTATNKIGAMMAVEAKLKELNT